MNNKKEFIVTTEYSAKRLDVFLCENIDGISRSAIQKNIANRLVKVDGKVVGKKNLLLDEGAKVQIDFPIASQNPDNSSAIPEIIPQDIPLDIVYEDADLLVVNKPQGMVVHPATSHRDGTLVNALMYYCDGKLSDLNGKERPGIVHRIDKDTSGLLVVAKTNNAHAHLAQQLKDKTTTRIYHAIVHGGLNFTKNKNASFQATGLTRNISSISSTDLEDATSVIGATIDKPIARHPQNRYKRAVVEGGKHAVTHYELIEQYGQYSYIKLKLETGRTHQIRVHMAYIGHPVVCDELYGVKREKIKHSGQILHAKTLGFMHPRTEEYMEFDSQLPDYFVKVLAQIKKYS